MRRALLACPLLLGCGASDVAPVPPPAPPRPPPAASPARTAPEPEPPAHGPTRSENGDYFAIGDLLGRKLDRLAGDTCAHAEGFRLERGIAVDQRPLAVRRCERFRGPQDALDDGGVEAGSTLTVISDGGRIVFAVSSKEYTLEASQRVFEALLRAASLAGCQQVESTQHSTGFVRCGNGVGWSAVSRVPIGDRHAVVYEVALERSVATKIAEALLHGP